MDAHYSSVRYVDVTQLASFDHDRLALRRRRCGQAARMLRDVPGIEVPGQRAHRHSYWLLPVMVAEPAVVAARMLAAGYDVTQGTTQLGPLGRYVEEQGEHFRALHPHEAHRMMDAIGGRVPTSVQPLAAEMGLTIPDHLASTTA